MYITFYKNDKYNVQINIMIIIIYRLNYIQLKNEYIIL